MSEFRYHVTHRGYSSIILLIFFPFKILAVYENSSQILDGISAFFTFRNLGFQGTYCICYEDTVYTNFLNKL